MPLSADLQTSFTSGGFTLEGAFGDLGSLLTAVGLPSLDLDVSVSLDVEGLGTDGITEVASGIGGNLASISGALPDLVDRAELRALFRDPLEDPRATYFDWVRRLSG